MPKRSFQTADENLGLAPEPRYRQTRKRSKEEIAERATRRSKKSQTSEPAQQLTSVVFNPRNPGQRALHQALSRNRLVFGVGPAGTGKTMLAISQAVDLFLAGTVDRIVLTRPAVEAGEKLGFLPGDIAQKLDPYMRPLYDSLVDKLGGGPLAMVQIKKWLSSGQIEIGPLGMLRGRTMKNCVVVADEIQNATYEQIKMLLTRLGEKGYMFVNGDPQQTDLPPGQSGLADVADRLEKQGKFPVIYLTKAHVVRDPIVQDLLDVLP